MVVWSMAWIFLLSPLYLTFSRLLILEVTQIKDKKILCKIYDQMRLGTFREAIIKMSTHNKCLGGYREKGTLLHCWRECKLVQPLWKTVETLLKKLNMTLSCAVLCLVVQSCPTLCKPMDSSLPSSSVHGDSPGKNTGVGCHALLQGIFPTQGSKPGLLHCRQILYHWAMREGSMNRGRKSHFLFT